MTPLRTIIVEDEPLSQQYLGNLLSHFLNVAVVAKAATEEEAIHLIQSLKPQLVFLDIELHSGSGFEVLKKTEGLHYSVVFTTALEYHAINIIKLSGVAFLQKPIDLDGLEGIVQEVENAPAGSASYAVTHLLKTLHNNHTPLHMAVYGPQPLEYIEIEELLYITSSGDETVLHLQNEVIKKDSRSLKEHESILRDFHFFRIAATHIVNLKKIKAASTSEDVLFLTNGTSIPLSPKRREALITKLEHL